MNYSWAPGFRFYPTEEELVSFYLQNKLLDPNRQDLDTVIPLLDIYEFSPGDLPKYAGEICAGDGEQWFFFIPRQDKEAQGGRPNRLTSSGYWKATGSPGFVYSSQNRVIGLKKTMVFYKGRAPKGTKTEWKLNEYRAAAAATIATAIEGLQPHSSSSTSNSSATPQFRQELSLCRLYKRSKCLRSFDRRPLLTTGEGSGSVDHPQAPARSDHHHEAATTAAATTSHHENQNSSSPILMVDRNMIMPSSSPSADDVSSSLGDHSNSNNTNPSDHLDSDLPIWEWEWEWDWEPFNWINDQGEDHL